MKLAVLSDIHGNIRALEAVVADAEKAGVDRYVSLGDMFFMGLDGQACFDRLMDINPLVCIKGNTDANLEEVASFVPSNTFEQHLMDLIVYYDATLSPSTKHTIACLPIVSHFSYGSNRYVFCHGSPYSFQEGLSSSFPCCDATQEKLEKEPSSLLFCGHTHCPEDFLIGSQHIVNPGAVGYSFDGDWRASYAILDTDVPDGQCQIRRIGYDIETYRKEILAQCERFPLLQSVAYALEHGQKMTFSHGIPSVSAPTPLN